MTESSNQPRTAPRPVVVAVHGGPAGRDVIATAAQFAALTSAPLIAVHVRARPTTMEYLAVTSIPTGADPAIRWRDELERDAWLDCISVLGPTTLHWQFTLVHGDVSTAIKQLSEHVGASAVFVGTRTHRHLHRCPARALARSSSCPIHLVEHP